MDKCTVPHCTSGNFTEEVKSIKSTEFSCTWKIANFKIKHPGVGNCISTENSDSFDENSLWTVFLYPDGYDSDFSSKVGVVVLFNRNLLQLDYSPYQLMIHFIDKKGREIEMHRSEEKRTNRYILKNFICKHFLFKDENSKNFLPNGTLSIKFKIVFLVEEVHRYRPDSIVSPAGGEPKLHGLESIFNVEKFSDVKIAVGDKLFYAYKGILANQSPVFAAMFEHDMKESKENIVQIEDVDHAVMEQLLRFVYAGKVNGIEVVARDLLAAADKYELKQLKTMCVEALIKDLSVKTVTSLLIAADKYGAEILKKRALMYFKIHAKEVIKTEEFKKDLFNLAPIFPEIIEKFVL